MVEPAEQALAGRGRRPGQVVERRAGEHGEEPGGVEPEADEEPGTGVRAGQRGGGQGDAGGEPERQADGVHDGVGAPLGRGVAGELCVHGRRRIRQ